MYGLFGQAMGSLGDSGVRSGVNGGWVKGLGMGSCTAISFCTLRLLLCMSVRYSIVLSVSLFSVHKEKRSTLPSAMALYD